MDLNNKYLGTVSNKIKKVDLLTQYITDRINDNQNIKRFLFYNTVNPLAARSRNYAGELINQPDIIEDLSDSDGKQYIFNGIFDPLIKTEEKNMVFVHSPSSSFSRNTNRIKIDVNILCHNDVNKLASKGITRLGEIACEICDMFDDIYIDKNNAPNYVDDLGNLQFEVIGRSMGRVSEKDMTLVYRLNLEVVIPNTLRGYE